MTDSRETTCSLFLTHMFGVWVYVVWQGVGCFACIRSTFFGPMVGLAISKAVRATLVALRTGACCYCARALVVDVSKLSEGINGGGSLATKH